MNGNLSMKPSDLEKAQEIVQDWMVNEVEVKTRPKKKNPKSLAELIATAISEAREELQFKLDDINDAYRKVMDEKCASDEVHCTCVPHLRRGIAEARREEGEIVHKQMNEIMDKAIERARREERRRFKEIVMNEPELPGDAPVDIQNKPIEAVCRAACRVTKKNIIKAIEDLD